MKSTDPFYREFLTELDALDRFLLRRNGPDAHVERVDPDVRRIMESLAFFSARTRQISLEHMNTAMVRLAQDYLDEYLHPQPARAIIHAQPTDRLLEATTLPQGTLVRMTTRDNQVGLFTTMRRATLLPLELTRVALELLPGSGFRLLIGLAARRPMRSLPQPLAFYIDSLGDYRSSARLVHALRTHMVRASAFFGDEPTVRAIGAPCRVAMGKSTLEEPDQHLHPLAEIASFFHFPEQQLFLHAELPAPRHAWRQAWIAVDLDADWPTDLVVNQEMFQLFAIPVENVRRNMAETITCDGTQDSYALAAPPPYHGDRVHSVAGVYREVEGGYQPILPAHLAPFQRGDQDCWELDLGHLTSLEPAETHEDQPRLRLQVAGAFQTPCKVAVEARWYQPDFDAHAVGRLDVALQTRHLEGVRWLAHGRVRAHRTSSLERAPFELLHLLALQGKAVFSRDELLYALRLCGADDSSVFGEIAGLVAAVEVSEERSSLRGVEPEYVYRVVTSPAEDDDAALLADYVAQIRALLAAWSKRRTRVIAAGPGAKPSQETLAG